MHTHRRLNPLNINQGPSDFFLMFFEHSQESLFLSVRKGIRYDDGSVAMSPR